MMRGLLDSIMKYIYIVEVTEDVSGYFASIISPKAFAIKQNAILAAKILQKEYPNNKVVVSTTKIEDSF